MSRSRLSGRSPATWVVVFFALNLLLQRVSGLPSLSISVSTLLVLVWAALALRAGVVVVEPQRLLLWLLAAGTSALVVIPQMLWVTNLQISPTSWAFWMVNWLPVALRIRENTRDNYVRCVRGVGWIGVGASTLSVVFLGSQLLGIPYRDYVADFLPDALEVGGYVIAYPVAWGSSIYKSNAWIALEPSFLSFTLGVCAVCALLARMSPWAFAWILVGILTTVAGSGLAVLMIAVVVLLVTRQVRGRGRHLLVTVGLVAIGAFTPLRELVYSRAAEVNDSGSSSSLRAVEPYSALWPDWISEPLGTLFGYGAGSSQRLVEQGGVLGLLVPNVAKMLFDYGLFVGLVLVALIVVAHVGRMSTALGVSLLISLLFLQTASAPMLNCLFAVVTWWAPVAAAGSGDRWVTRAHARPLPRPARRPEPVAGTPRP